MKNKKQSSISRLKNRLLSIAAIGGPLVGCLLVCALGLVIAALPTALAVLVAVTVARWLGVEI